MTDNERLREAITTLRQDVAMWTGRVGAAAGESANRWKLVLDCAESLLPKTKMVEVWRVEYAKRWRTSDGDEWMPCVYQHTSCSMAEEHAAAVAKDGWPKTCIRVTGPHQQEVPA